MNLPEERAARNEALFREVNEQVRSISASQPSTPAEKFLIICECSDDRCTERVSLPLGVYESVRANPRRFVVVAGHDNDFERVVERSDGYAVVEKEGDAGRVAEQTDPRT
jgi:hypothetical protein